MYVELHHDESTEPLNDPGQSYLESEVLELPDEPPTLPPPDDPPEGDADVTIVNVDDDDEIELGDTYTAVVSVENQEDELAGDTIRLQYDGETEDLAPIELDPGETTSVILTWGGYPTHGTYSLDLVSDSDRESTSVTVIRETGPGPQFPTENSGWIIMSPQLDHHPGPIGVIPSQ